MQQGHQKCSTWNISHEPAAIGLKRLCFLGVLSAFARKYISRKGSQDRAKIWTGLITYDGHLFPNAG
jgi:hypothetical protein